jgi:hypothetical protein
MTQEKNPIKQIATEKLLSLNQEILNLEKEKEAELEKKFIGIQDISHKNKGDLSAKGYISKPSWGGKVIKKEDLDYINEKYDSKIDSLKNEVGSTKKDNISAKQAEKELSKLKIDNTLIANRTKELIEQEYTETVAKEIAGLESVIDISKKRVAIYNSAPTIKDQEQRLAATQKTIQNSNTRLQELLKIESINKNPISNKQKIRNAEEEIRKISKDEKNINETKTALINSGYSEGDALKMAELMDIIAGDEKRKEILINNPGIQNCQKELDKVEKRLAENKIVFEKLKTDSVKQVPKNPNEQNQNASEKEKEVKTIKEKLMGFFRRKEKQKVEVYTEEEEKAWILFIKSEIEKGTDKLKVQELIILHNEEKRRLEVERGPLSPRIKSGITNGIKNWDNWGSEGGWSGYVKKMGKMTVSIALIAGISTFSVEKAASIGLGTVSALGSGRIANKMLIGLGLGTAMELTNGMAAEKRQKIQKIFSLSMMAISAGIAIGTGGGIVAGAAVGGSAVFGYLSSKLVQKKFSEEKIKAKLDAIKNRPINIGTLDEDLARIEKETKEILKYAENTRLLRKLVGGTVAIGASVGMLEASGYVKDLHTEHQQQEINDFNDKHEANLKHIDEMNEKHVQHEAEMKNHAEQTEQQTKNDSENQNNQPETNNQAQQQTETNNVTQSGNIQEFMKSNATQDAIKLGMYNPGETNESMNVQSGTVSFDANGHHVEVPYSSHGAIQTILDLKKAIADEFGGEEKIPNGNISTHYVDMKGIEHNQDLIHSDTSGAVVIEKYNGTMFDSDHSHATAEHTTHDGLPSDNKVPEQINPETGLPMNHTDGVGDHTNTQGVDDYKVPAQVDPTTGQHINGVDNQNTNGSENTISNISQLSQEGLDHVHKVFDHNIDHLFRERPMSSWNYIKDHVSATRMMEMYKEGEIKEDFKPLVHYMDNLKDITGIKPQGVDLLHPDLETIPHYIGRALEEAERTGQIEKVTL